MMRVQNNELLGRFAVMMQPLRNLWFSGLWTVSDNLCKLEELRCGILTAKLPRAQRSMAFVLRERRLI